MMISNSKKIFLFIFIALVFISLLVLEYLVIFKNKSVNKTSLNLSAPSFGQKPYRPNDRKTAKKYPSAVNFQTALYLERAPTTIITSSVAVSTYQGTVTEFTDVPSQTKINNQIVSTKSLVIQDDTGFKLNFEFNTKFSDKVTVSKNGVVKKGSLKMLNVNDRVEIVEKLDLFQKPESALLELDIKVIK